MITTKLASKRGRPKRKNSDPDESSDEFTKKKVTSLFIQVPKKAQKAATVSKKAI